MLMIWYRIGNWLHRHKVPLFPKLIYLFTRAVFRCSVPATCVIGRGTRFGYKGQAVVIHARAHIGNNCMIGTCVTIGGKSGWYEVPKIGNNVEIHSGAKIIGPIKVGNNVIIGANAVVTKDVPDNCVVAGIPAKIIAKDTTPTDYTSAKPKYRGNNPWLVTPEK